ncbi:MAG: hypothetical protein JO053_08970 [Acidobacteria bacterium]|nr:hypothetical protein [Acidobacteriota bacterium]
MQNNSGQSVFGLDQNVAAGLAYIPICFCHLIISIGILASDKVNKLPRFHAIQSLLLSATMIIGYVVCLICVFVVMMIGAALNSSVVAIFALLFYGVLLLFILACLIGLIISCIKGFTGQIFKLPIIGNLADKWSN